MVINHWVVINRDVIARDNILSPLQGHHTPEQLYTTLECSYPKFYKMDKLCKWAFVASEYLLAKNDLLYSETDKNKIAVVLATSHGCIDVDKRYFEGIAVPSPALFVYTLPNIMLGEIAIRRGFKGEQLCMVSEAFGPEELYFSVHRLLKQGGMDACLCGWADASDDGYDICLFWITNNGAGLDITPAILNEIYQWRHK